jgi:hypothetical protein
MTFTVKACNESIKSICTAATRYKRKFVLPYEKDNARRLPET